MKPTGGASQRVAPQAERRCSPTPEPGGTNASIRTGPTARIVARYSPAIDGPNGAAIDRFSLRNLRNIRLLYQAFPIRQALPAELTWTHLLLVLRVEEPLAREFYVKQCQRERWSTRELERQLNSLLFERLALPSAVPVE